MSVLTDSFSQLDQILGLKPVVASARRIVSSGVRQPIPAPANIPTVSKIQSDYLKGDVMDMDAINKLVESGMAPADAQALVSGWGDENPVGGEGLDIIVGRKM